MTYSVHTTCSYTLCNRIHCGDKKADLLWRNRLKLRYLYYVYVYWRFSFQSPFSETYGQKACSLLHRSLICRNNFNELNIMWSFVCTASICQSILRDLKIKNTCRLYRKPTNKYNKTAGVISLSPAIGKILPGSGSFWESIWRRQLAFLPKISKYSLLEVWEQICGVQFPVCTVCIEKEKRMKNLPPIFQM